jgi:hypothetical protein
MASVPVVLGEVSVDRLLQRDQRVEDARRRCRLVSLAKKVSTAFSHEHEVGMK